MEQIEKLLNFRWKVRIDIPFFPYKSGDIIESRTDYVLYSHTTGHFKPKSYPDVFKLLKWWQERDISEMPRFIKFERKPGKFLVYEVCSPHEGFPAFGENFVNFFDEEGKIVMEEMRDLRNFLPATEEEFLQFKHIKHETDS